MMDLRPSTLRPRAGVCFTLGFLTLAAIAVPAVHAGPFVDAGWSPASMNAWASAIDEIVRGPIDIDDPGGASASFGAEVNIVGAATGDPADAVSLGDGGSATLIFHSGISDGEGDDFAVFENGILDLSGLFAELAYVEVSTDGILFARFDSDAFNTFPVMSFDTLDPTDYHGLAGRHPAGLGTGFDLADLAFDSLVLSSDVDLASINFVRVVDVIGDGSTTDGGANPIFDPYTTPFPSGGFDLEAIGVIHVPEPSWALGVLTGLLALIIMASRSRSVASAHHIASRAGFVIATFFCVASPAAALTVTFEDLGLGAESFENGSGLSDGLVSNGVFFENNYNATYDSFTGYAASTMTDTTTPGFGNQFSNITGSGAGGSDTYGIAFLTGSIILPSATVVQSAEFTNTTYTALSMLNGDAFAKTFGGISGDDPDFFRLIIEGIDSLGASTGTVDLFLADYTSANPLDDYVLDEWTLLNLSGLGTISELRFSFESSDIGDFGINTPVYFSIDNLVTIPEPSTALLLGLGIACLTRRSAATMRSRR